MNKPQREAGDIGKKTWRPAHTILGCDGNIGPEGGCHFLQMLGNDTELCLDPYPAELKWTNAPKWATEERSPGAGKRNIILKEVLRKIQEAWPSPDVDKGGALWHAAKEVARCCTDTEQWQKRVGWTFERETGISFDEIALQEVWPPMETTRCSMNGYTIMYREIARKEAGVAIAIWHDIMRRSARPASSR